MVKWYEILSLPIILKLEKLRLLRSDQSQIAAKSAWFTFEQLEKNKQGVISDYQKIKNARDKFYLKNSRSFLQLFGVIGADRENEFK